MSFLKVRQNRLEAFKNLGPLLSIPIALATSLISAPVFSQSSDITADEIAVLESIGSVRQLSEDQTFVLKFYQQTPTE
jgi:hypothetical protein